MADLRIFSSKSGLVKIAALCCLIVAMSIYFSIHVVVGIEKSATYFITAMIISPFIYTTFLIIVYVFGGMVIQKTLYEFLMNTFYTIMLISAAIVLFAISNDDSGAIASGLFLLFASFCYAADIYFALQNMGALQSADASATGPGGSAYPPMPTVQQQNQPPDVRSQPFTQPPTYNPPPSLVGPGPYTVPGGAATTSPGGATSVDAGDLSNQRSI